ncbi:hypothetical protein [Bacillus nakamurai]|uniref:hypothetical protein n=1 Tax=Bacillus nakamurai TaxID=1793963 RepID=UPI0020C56CAB|nr:hypothetical protein [Bacillus nakamurai]MCP6682470.1 hypothetical protein [Bacillus nakamurai]
MRLVYLDRRRNLLQAALPYPSVFYCSIYICADAKSFVTPVTSAAPLSEEAISILYFSFFDNSASFICACR